METHSLVKKTSTFSWKEIGKGWLVFALLFTTTLFAFGQEYEVSGKVSDAQGNPIPGVNILIQGTTLGTVTDIEGAYTLKITSESAVIQISAVGYISEEFTVNGAQVVDITLDEDVTQLSEIVVIGYGTQKSSLVTGAISSVNSEDMENKSNARVEDAMQGKVAGVFILPESGAPGAGVNMRIRGTGTNGNSNPLYIVDGIRMSDVNDISPNDIESVEVLKDAASSAIYGAEGGNGVVIITTKGGSNKEGVVNYSFSYGLQNVGTLPTLLTSSQYNEYQAERGYTATPSAYNTDWLDEIFETAPVSTHSLSFTGGSEKTSYYASLTYFDQDGIIGGDKSNFNRMTTRINADHKIKSWLKVSANINYARSNRTVLSEDDEFGGLISTALKIDPYTPTHYAPEDFTQNMQDLINAGEPVRKDDADGRYYAISDNIQGEMINPLLQMDLATGKRVTDRVIGVFAIEITPFEGLTITSRPGVDFSKSNFHDWTPSYYYSNERNNSSLNVNDNYDTYFQWQWENFVSYNKLIGDHNISAVLGMSAQESEDKFLNTNSGVMVREGDRYAEHDYTSSNTGIISGNAFPNKLVSYFGRVGYDYKNKYMIQATLRNDKTATTNVPKDGISGVFPSVSAGWTVSEESFFNKGFVNNVKVRGSWGQNGSIQSITSRARDDGQYLYTSTLTSAGLRYPTTDGFIVATEPNVLPNPDLTWETSQQTNIGLDMKFWKNRMNFTADYFVKETNDLLMRGKAPATSGTDDPMINAGDVKNSGFEFSLGIRNNDNDLKYGFNVNFATLKNEVTKLNVPTARINGANIGTGSWNGVTAFEVGEPIWYFRGYETNGIDDASGDPIFVDQNDDGEITDADRTNLGDPHPDIMYGASIYLEYKGLDLNVFLQGQAGNQIVYGWMRTDRLTSNMHSDFYEDRWTPTNTTGTMPAAGADSRMYASDIMVKDGAYTRIKQIQLGYTLPNSLLETIKLSNLRVYVSLDDYFTFTKYEGMDPEAGSTNDQSQGIDRGVYPTPKKLMFGLSVSF